ncbi:DNA-binding CsgD family transcriptional regulator [Dysgonomonas hofstadii]|uniref:DNA-binding CsgD family transcriptional regulator n=1 Tax=Dysgonomonas hofstadii TaxID=637886 RepID=A0A840CR33_9BACT|nr:LuxR C-terminal-related transcriptional regulator [Dysgonomonas hofstadii]MBB4036608.1 DNA-binding CsgD family transcriptional regulator [Dysgonomonas hofstadii]
MKLTTREEEILQLHSIGLTPDEIANKLYRSRETIRKTICNIKIKLNLQKASELTAYYWCEFFGASFVEQRKSILSACTCLLVLFTLSVDNFDKRRFRIRHREEYTEFVIIYSTL